MMKMFFAYLIKGLLICGIVLAIGLYLIYLKTGQFWVPNLPTFSLPSFGTTPKLKSLPKPTEAIYKWRQNGRWVYGEKPPENGSAKRVFLDAEEKNQ